MNRSIFQIGLLRWLNCVLISLLILFILNVNINIFCFSVKGLSDTLLKELQYKNIVFKCSNNVCDNDAYTALDIFLNNKHYNNLSFSVAKYFELKNGFALPFYKNTCYAHPNLFFGVYNNLYFNFQFSHNAHSTNFDFFTENDISGLRKTQYLSNQLYIYSNYLQQQFLNLNELSLNNRVVYKNNSNPILIQDYINFNNLKFNEVVYKAFKI